MNEGECFRQATDISIAKLVQQQRIDEQLNPSLLAKVNWLFPDEPGVA